MIKKYFIKLKQVTNQKLQINFEFESEYKSMYLNKHSQKITNT